MMYFLLILFFGSLFGIVFMIGKKLPILQNIETLYKDETFDGSYLEEWKYFFVQSVKKYSYLGLVATVRFYVHSALFLKRKYQEAKDKIEAIRAKKLNIGEIEKKEASKFLKMISDYKHKIRRIKHHIKEEEEENL